MVFMKTIVIASKNPVKIQAIQAGFARMFPGEAFTVQPISAPSGVPDQPGSDQETLAGAINRSTNARALFPQADYWAGIEGGIHDQGGQMWAFAWVAIQSGSRLGHSRTGIVLLPPSVAELVRAGKELGEADDMVFGSTNSKQAAGAVGLLTDGAIDRAAFYTSAVILALIPFKNEGLYPAVSP